MNDVLEAIVGDMPAISAENDDIAQREDGSWLIDGMLSLDRFKEFFDIDEALPGEAGGNIHTLGGGMMMFQLGRVPSVTDRLDWNGFGFEVVDMDKTRVDKILVTRLPAPPTRAAGRRRHLEPLRSCSKSREQGRDKAKTSEKAEWSSGT
ncbi:hypothetical protein JOS77_12135 [Chromobacterium haemolyticum]|nr:hypothetical protein JOS77_12135 [Chromobacterium haemolyticum]